MEFVAQKSISEQDGLVLDYALLRSPFRGKLPATPDATYSILCLLSDEDGVSDQEFVYDISTEKETALSFFRLLWLIAVGGEYESA